MKLSQFKVLGQPIEEFLVRWNVTSFYIGGLSQKFSNKLSRIYMNELKTSLASNTYTSWDSPFEKGLFN